MGIVWRVLKPVGLILSPILVVVGYVLDGKEIASVGLPIWAWQAIGAAAFAVAMIAIVLGFEKRQAGSTNTSTTASATTEKQGRTLIRLRKGADRATLRNITIHGDPESIVDNERAQDMNADGIRQFSAKAVAPEQSARDALDHAVAEGQRVGKLQIQKAFTPWRIGYPVFVGNRRGSPIRITGFNATVLWDDGPVDRVEWRAPDSDASNGLPIFPNGGPVPSLDIGGDHSYTLHIPFNGRKVGSFPPVSPKWDLRGRIYLSAGGQTHELPFNLSDGYRISLDEWSTWVAQFQH